MDVSDGQAGWTGAARRAIGEGAAQKGSQMSLNSSVRFARAIGVCAAAMSTVAMSTAAMSTAAILTAAMLWPSGAAMAQTEADARQIAFPGAVGFGRFATGWRGGDVVYVTNLANAGPGSLRACAQHSGAPRVCVFAVSGTITIDETITVAPNTYIAGQTAPAHGVQLRLGAARRTALMLRRTHDVLLRFLKLRPGPSREVSSNVDGIGIFSSANIYVDHASIQFATDENINIGSENLPTANITIANSIAAWGLDRSTHPDGRHSKGALICSDDGAAKSCGRITLIGNVFAHNRDRNPDVASSPLGPIEVINNVFYNATSQFGEFYTKYGPTYINYVGNVVLPGPSTVKRGQPAAIEAERFGRDFPLEIFASDNLHLDRQAFGGCETSRPRPIVDPRAEPFMVDAPRHPLSVTPMRADATLEAVTTTAGARIGLSRALDRLDAQVMDDVLGCAGRRIDAPIEVGGWPKLLEYRGPTDSDQDGMSDGWETARAGLDPNDASDAWADRDGDGWSNLEEYLSVLAGDISATN